ncbi:MAG: aminoacyl-tRNA hydrolase [Bacteroidales bacterium]|nr:aminoacyl-tRNA hydrolase [Bacteroidales bacterium]
MSFLIAGLGNIGSEYADTRHNAGFYVLDTLARLSNIAFISSRYGYIAEYKYKGKRFLLLKPSTYMNLSGKAVNYWLNAEKIDQENMLVVVDDIALQFGSLRMRKQGSDGGHNGLKDIISTLGNSDFPRLRIGIGGDFPKGGQIDYVLGKWTDQEIKSLPGIADKAVEVIKLFGTEGVEKAMNYCNAK